MPRKRLTTPEFIEKARTVHGDKYDYSRVAYVNSKTRITISCKTHGYWSCQPDVHLTGKGCPTCGSKPWTITTQSFIDDCTKLHGGVYDYSKTCYVRSSQKVIVTCNHHGDFTITPNDHRKGRGCSRCAETGYSINKPGTLYVLQSEGVIKVGITNRAVHSRVNEINKTVDEKFMVSITLHCNDGLIPQVLERQLKEKLKAKYKQPKHKFDGYTECFLAEDASYTSQLITELLQIYHERQYQNVYTRIPDPERHR